MAANITKSFEARTPAFQLEFPLEYVTTPHDNKMRAPVTYKKKKSVRFRYLKFIKYMAHKEYRIQVNKKRSSCIIILPRILPRYVPCYTVTGVRLSRNITNKTRTH